MPRLTLLSALLSLTACKGDDPADTQGDSDGADATPTWHGDVAPIVEARCASCHTDGGIGLFGLDSYEGAKPMAALMVSTVDAGTMPPWAAHDTDSCTPPLPWKDDLRLSEAEKATLRAWVEAGAPEGDPATAAELPARPDTTLPGATHTLRPVSPYTVSGDQDQFICFAFDPQLTEDQWITGLQVEADNDAVAHHALVFADYSGRGAAQAGDQGWFPCDGGGLPADALVGAWAPGAMPTVMPADVGMAFPAGSQLVMQMHYHPAGAEDAPDATSISVRMTPDRPTYEADIALVGNFDRGGDPSRGALLAGPNDEGGIEFRIPAGATDHTEQMVYQLTGLGEGVLKIFSAGTHMHYVGVDMDVRVEHADPKAGEAADECLVQTPAWNFEWQRSYAYDAPVADLPELRNRDTLHMNCTYDNSLDNPGVRQSLRDLGLDAPIDVYLGEQTTDEMCLGVLGIIYYSGL